MPKRNSGYTLSAVFLVIIIVIVVIRFVFVVVVLNNRSVVFFLMEKQIVERNERSNKSIDRKEMENDENGET